jgi:methylenetetrahydrofolate reductase (NADPH)
LENPRFELIPLPSGLDQAKHLPEGAAVSVTVSPKRTLENTIEFAADLTDRGFRAMPHLSARMTRDRSHLESVLARIARLGIDEVLVIGGDGEPRGDFFDASSLLRAMESVGHNLRIDIAGYPEGHHLFDDETARRALHDKQPLARHLVTQMCFDGTALSRWLAAIRADGITLPAVLGIPGVADRLKLMRIATRIGVGQSVRYLSKSRGLLRAYVRPVRYTADDLLQDVAASLTDPVADVVGLHIYTFNQVETTERWRHDYLESL